MSLSQTTLMLWLPLLWKCAHQKSSGLWDKTERTGFHNMLSKLSRAILKTTYGKLSFHRNDNPACIINFTKNDGKNSPKLVKSSPCAQHALHRDRGDGGVTAHRSNAPGRSSPQGSVDLPSRLLRHYPLRLANGAVAFQLNRRPPKKLGPFQSVVDKRKAEGRRTPRF